MSKKNYNYFVVKFPEEEDSLFVVPTSWVPNGEKNKAGKCQWPPLKNTDRIKHLSRLQVLPETTWKVYDCIVVCGARSFQRAEEKLNLYQYNSDLDSSQVEFMPVTDVQPASELSVNEVTPIPTTTISDVSINCASCKDNTDLLLQLIASVQHMQQQLDSYTAVIGKENAVCTFNQQLKTIEELETFNENIEDNEQFATMVKNLGFLGGRDKAESTRKILSRLIHNDLAKQINWQGTENRRSIQEFSNILDLVAVSVRQNKRFADATAEEVNNALKFWFRNAGDRNGGRSARLKRKMMEVLNMNINSIN